MNLEFDKSFAKNLEKINDKSIQKKLIKIHYCPIKIEINRFTS